MKKQHDAVGLANELEGSSAFFQERKAMTQQQPTSSPAPEDRPLERPTTRPSDVSTTPPSGRPMDAAMKRSAPRPEHRPPQRSLQRRSFEFYVDQLETLKAWSLQAQLRGEKTSMSEMLRSALDTYLAAQRASDDPTKRPADAPEEESQE